MKLHLKYLIPSVYEVVAVSFLTLLMVVLANSRQLLSYYGLQSSNQVLQSSASEATSRALSTLDSFSATDGIVTFLIWAAVGVVCYSIVMGLVRAYNEFEYEEKLSSNRYVHPSTFTKAKFWKGVLGDFIGTAVGLAVLAVAVYALMLMVLPVGLAYSRVFLFDVTIVNAAYFLLGLAIVFVGLLVVNICARALLQRHRLVAAPVS